MFYSSKWCNDVFNVTFAESIVFYNYNIKIFFLNCSLYESVDMSNVCVGAIHCSEAVDKEAQL